MSSSACWLAHTPGRAPKEASSQSLHIVRAVKNLRLDYGVQVAIHLCGRYSRMVMQDDGAPDEVYDLCNGFSRVQVNLHGDSFNPGRIAVASQAVKRFADTVGCQRVILQHRGGWGTDPGIP